MEGKSHVLPFLLEICLIFLRGRQWSCADDEYRFVSPDIKAKYDLDLPDYEGIDQVVEVGKNGEKL